MASCSSPTLRQTKAILARLVELKANLKGLDYDFDKLPIVFQFTGAAAPKATAVADLKSALEIREQPFFEADLTAGLGVFDTLKAVTKLVLMGLKTDADHVTASAAPKPAINPQASKPKPKVTR